MPDKQFIMNSELLKKYFKDRNITQEDIANALNISQPAVSAYLNGKPFGKNSAKKWGKEFGISPTWLLTGEGSITGHETEDNYSIIDTADKYKRAIEIGLKMLPEVDFTFTAGSYELVDNTNNITRYWYLPDCEDCEAVAPMVGNSMLPMIPPGCELVMKRYGFDTTKPNTIAFGNVYGVVVEDPITGKWHGHIKILRRHKDQELAKKYWIAHSVNVTEFDDFDIEIDKVRGLWVVKQHVVTNILL